MNALYQDTAFGGGVGGGYCYYLLYLLLYIGRSGLYLGWGFGLYSGAIHMSCAPAAELWLLLPCGVGTAVWYVCSFVLKCSLWGSCSSCVLVCFSPSGGVGTYMGMVWYDTWYGTVWHGVLVWHGMCYRMIVRFGGDLLCHKEKSRCVIRYGILVWYDGSVRWIYYG